MFLLLIRASALALIIATSAAHESGASCRQEIPAELIRDLWRRTTQLIKKLPKEEKVSRRLLPNFCTYCPARAIGWLELQEVINVYQKSVFSGEVIQKLLPLHYNQLLYRLQHTLTHCVSSSKPLKWLKEFKKLKRKLKNRRREEQTVKAVREFTFVLGWIAELTQHRIL